MMVYLERRDPQKNMARFYAMAIVPTLFGEWAVVREWGRIGSPGRVTHDTFRSVDQAAAFQQTITTKKAQRGYAMR